MSQAALAWRAFRNMLRAAARDPLWAIIAVITAPFRLWQPVAGVLILIVLMLLGLAIWIRTPSYRLWSDNEESDRTLLSFSTWLLIGFIICTAISPTTFIASALCRGCVSGGLRRAGG